MADGKYFRQAKRGVFYNRTTGEKYEAGYFLINEAKLEDKTEWDPFELGGETVATAVKKRTYKISATAGSYEDGMMERLLNATVTDYSANASGEVYSLENVNGDSVYDATTGVASVYIDDSSKLINCDGVIKATGASTVTVNLYNVDTDYTSGSLTISTGAYSSTGIADYGLALLGGSGTIGLTTGDTATFKVRMPNYVGEKIFVDGNTDFTEIGIKLYPAKDNNEFAHIDCYRCKVGGQTIDIKDGWATYQIEADLLLDEAKDGYYHIERIRPE
jgi:hypothetical protein